MSLHEKLRELRGYLNRCIEIVDSLIAFLHFSPPPSEAEVSSGESQYGSVDGDELQIPSPPPLVRQYGMYQPIDISDEEEVKLDVPPSRRNADGSITYIRQCWD